MLTGEKRYIIKCVGKRVVELDNSVADTDVDEGTRVAVIPRTYKV